MARARAARPQQRDLDPPPLDQHPGDEEDRVAGEDRELDRQQQHAAPADERPPVDLAEDVRQRRFDAQRPARQPVVAEPGVERQEVGPERVQPTHPQAVDVGDRPPLQVDLPAGDAPHEVLLVDDEGPGRRERAAGLDAVELERAREPVGVGRVRLPDPDDLQLVGRGRVVAADERDRVADVQAERGRRALGQRGLDGSRAGGRPRAVDERRVVRDAAVARDPDERGLVGRVGALRREAAAGRDEPDFPAGRAEDLLRLGRDDVVDRVDVGRRRARADDDDAVRRRRVEDRLAQPAERDDVAVDGARGEQDRCAEQQQPRREDDRPVRPTAMEQGAPEPGRTEQAVESSRIQSAEGLCPDIHRPPGTGSRARVRAGKRGGEA